MTHLEYVFRHHRLENTSIIVEREGELDNEQEDVFAEDILKDVVSTPADWYLSDVFDSTPGKPEQDPTEVKYCY